MHIPSTTLVLMRADITSAEHYRTTYTAAAEAPVYILIGTPEQGECDHSVAFNLGRFGDAECASCSAPLWSLRWLAVDVFGPNTVTYGATEVETLWEAMRMAGVVALNTMEHQIIEAMRREHIEVAEYDVEPKHRDRCGPKVVPMVEQPTEVIAAYLNPDAPAKRPGIPVPHMDLVDVDWTPDPAA